MSGKIALTIGVAASLLLFCCCTAPLHAQPFTATDLGTIAPNGTNQPFDVNTSHKVVGSSPPNPNPPFAVGYSWTPSGGIVPLPGAGPIRPYRGSATNLSGQIAGSTETSAFNVEAFRLTGSTMTLLGTLSPALQSEAWGMNIHGDVVGACYDRNGFLSPVGFIYRGGAMSVAGQLRDARDINDSGFVVGVGGTPEHPMLWDSNLGTTTNLGTLGGTAFASKAVAINNANQVVGWSNTSTAATHAYVWTSATGMVDLNLTSIGANQSYAQDINNSGEIVGDFGSTGATRPFYWSNGFAIDLNNWLPGGSGWVLQTANAISDDGCIVGTGLLNGAQRGYIMCIPEPGSAMALAGPAVCALIRRGRRSGRSQP